MTPDNDVRVLLTVLVHPEAVVPYKDISLYKTTSLTSKCSTLVRDGARNSADCPVGALNPHRGIKMNFTP